MTIVSRAPVGIGRRLREPLSLAAAAALSVAFGVAGADTDPQLAIGVLLALVVAALGFLRPALFLCAFVLVRPVLDNYSELTVGLESANPAGLLSTLVLGLAVTLPLARRRIVFPRPAAPLALIVLLTAGGSALAMFRFGGTVGTEPVAELVRVAALLALFLLAANVLSDEERIRRVVIVAGLSGVLPAIMALTELLGGGPEANSLGFERISGPFNGPNPLGTYLAVSALVLIGMPRGWLATHARLLALTPILVALVPTYSRIGYVTLLGGLMLLEGRRRKRLVATVVVGAALTVALVPSVQDRVLPANDPTGDTQSTYESFGWRFANWGSLLEKWSEQPIAGYGTKTTVAVNPRRPVAGRFDDAGGYEAHNAVVRILVEGGVVLLAAYLWFAVAMAGLLRRLRRQVWSLTPVTRLLTALWAMFAVVSVGTDDPFEQTSVVFLLITLTGALGGYAWRLGGRPAVPPEPPAPARALTYLPARGPAR